MSENKFRVVNQPVRKKDAMQLLLGGPAYVDDVTPHDCLVVKVLRSPHAHALIEEINTDIALKVPGIECVFTYKDVPQKRFTMAGQTFPEPSPYDRLILDQRVRFVGDAVAIVAGESEKAVDKALKLIKVKYQVLEPVLDIHTAKDNRILVHPEDNWRSLCPVGADNQRNLCASDTCGDGDVDAVLADCDEVVDHVYHTKACQQAMMETFRTYTEIDHYGRLHIISSTQIVFHVRRIIANALDIPKSKIHVEKPRIGGGFGAKQTVVAEVYPALVTWKTGKPAKMIYTREECQIAGSPRHEMEVHVRVGANKDGVIRAIDVYTLSNTGAFGEHGPTTVGLSGHKSIPLYTGNLEAFRFAYDVVYTNVQAAGAYRGYGATQGIFAVESAVSELADRLGIDPVAIREKNMVREGQIMPAYYEQYLKSAYPNEDVSPYEAFQGIDETKDFPEMIYLLNQVKNYRGEGITAKLFYEGKVAEAVSLILQYNKNSTARTEQNISHQDMLLLNSVTAYINDHFSLKLSLEQLARIACMGTTKLKKLFKQVHGCTISEYIQQRRMSHAESLLATTDLTIEQISVSVGYSNPGGFSDVFRKSTGLLPKEYRKMAQKK